MPLDHFVSQVHLKNFYSPALGDRMYAIRKSDMKCFTPNSKSVCRIQDGSTNAFLREDRVIEEFLRTIEPNYNSALRKLKTRRIDADCVYVFSGFVAFVLTCSPAAMRIHSEQLRNVAEVTAKKIDAKGLIPPPPPVLGGTSLTELIENGSILVNIDPKFPQAIGITQILKLVTAFGNFRWEILQNDFDDSPFFTSDFPVAIERSENSNILNRIVPLAPDLAIRIKSDLTIERDKSDLNFENFKYLYRKIKRKELSRVNRLLVQCAEDLVFYRDYAPWIYGFVKRNQHYRVETINTNLPAKDGTFLIATQRIVGSNSRG